MAHGLRIRRQNDSRIQIDETFANLELVTSGTLTFSGLESSKSIAAPSGRTNVVIALRPTTAGTTACVVKATGGGFTVYKGGSDGAVAYHLFADPLNTPTPDKVGLVVRNRATGKIVYNSNYKYLKILDAFPVSLALGQSLTKSYDSSKVVALIACLVPWNHYEQSVLIQGTYRLAVDIRYCHMRRVSNASFVLAHEPTVSAGGAGAGSEYTYNNSQPQGFFLVADVTGL